MYTKNVAYQLDSLPRNRKSPQGAFCQRKVFFVICPVVYFLETLIYFLKNDFCPIKAFYSSRYSVYLFRVANSVVDK